MQPAEVKKLSRKPVLYRDTHGPLPGREKSHTNTDFLDSRIPRPQKSPVRAA
jgi:hypothetical protein